MGVEFALGAVRNKAFEDVGLAEADELEHLVVRDFALEDGLADADAMRVFFGDDLGHVVGFVGGENLVGFAVLGLGLADEMFFGEVGRAVAIVAFEDEVDLEFCV